VNLRDEVAQADVDRAMELTETLVGQTFDGSTGQFQSERTKGGSQDDRISQVKAIVRDLEGEHAADIDDVLTEAQERINLSVSKTEDYVDQLKTKGKLYEPGEGELRTT